MSDSSNNPFLSAAEPAELSAQERQAQLAQKRAEESDARRNGRDILSGGPAAPILSVPAPPSAEALPILPVWRGPHPRAWLVGLHGGAGVSTLLRYLPEWQEARGWPTEQDGTSGQVVLVARAHRQGLDRAASALQQWASGALREQISLLGVVIVDDAPRVSKPAKAQIERLSAMAPVVWRVRWIEQWRTLPENEQEPSDQLRKITLSLRTAAAPDASGSLVSDTPPIPADRPAITVPKGAATPQWRLPTAPLARDRPTGPTEPPEGPTKEEA